MSGMMKILQLAKTFRPRPYSKLDKFENTIITRCFGFVFEENSGISRDYRAYMLLV